jgi:hypothetical protein
MENIISNLIGRILVGIYEWTQYDKEALEVAFLVLG